MCVPTSGTEQFGTVCVPVLKIALSQSCVKDYKKLTLIPEKVLKFWFKSSFINIIILRLKIFCNLFRSLDSVANKNGPYNPA